MKNMKVNRLSLIIRGEKRKKIILHFYIEFKNKFTVVLQLVALELYLKSKVLVLLLRK